MIRLFLPSALLVILFLVWVFAIFDVIATDQMLMRNIPNKMMWLFIVVFLWAIGALAWFVLGRPAGAGLSPGATRTNPNRAWQLEQGVDRRRPPRRRPRGIEDRPDWQADTRPSAPRRKNDEADGADER